MTRPFTETATRGQSGNDIARICSGTASRAAVQSLAIKMPRQQRNLLGVVSIMVLRVSLMLLTANFFPIRTLKAKIPSYSLLALLDWENVSLLDLYGGVPTGR